MNQKTAPKPSTLGLDHNLANKLKLEGRDCENYQVDKKREALGKSTYWLRQKMGVIPASIRARIYKAFSGTASPREAISAMCHQCVGYQNARESISDCRGASCPLYFYRPYQTSRE